MTDEAMSPLRRRMIEDMTIRKFAPKTQHDYVQRVKDFATFLGRSPDTAKSEDVRSFRLHLASSGAGTPKINATVSALRFFFNVTLDRPDLAKHLSFMREPRKVLVEREKSVVLDSLELRHGRRQLPIRQLSHVEGWDSQGTHDRRRAPAALGLVRHPPVAEQPKRGVCPKRKSNFMSRVFKQDGRPRSAAMVGDCIIGMLESELSAHTGGAKNYAMLYERYGARQRAKFGRGSP